MSTSTALLAPDEFDLHSVVEALECYTLDIQTLSFLNKTSRGLSRAPARAVLISPRLGLVDLIGHTIETRKFLKTDIPLLLCCPQLTATDREELTNCGASGFLTPRTWNSGAVAERILADLILLGEVQPLALGSLRGGTKVMHKLYYEITTVAKTSEPVLIVGETGTGKELVAREIHRSSGRPSHLMAINCAALSPDLLESELFGHERGAFSGAIANRKGLLAEAGEGTVFLDEIGDLAPSAQAKLLRVLEEKVVRPVGGNRWLPIQARIVLATHRDLEERSQSGGFRQDLYERIQGFSLSLPPLRERRADLLLLLHHFVKEYDQEYGGTRMLPKSGLDPLFRYEWPGNVRQLRQALRRAAAFADSDIGPVSALTLLDAVQRRRSPTQEHTVTFDPTVETWRSFHDRVRAQYFLGILAAVGGNKDAAARRAGISRSQLYEILKQIEEESDSRAL